MLQCVLLNADYSFLNTVDWKRAVRLMIKKKVEVIQFSDRCIQGIEGVTIKLPAVMRLSRLIRTIYRSHVPFSKKNTLMRDGFCCAYCGLKIKQLTIDHIIPRSRGGKTSYENCVASCRNCNTLKGCRTPGEAGMSLRVKPYQPTIFEFIRIKVKLLGMDDTRIIAMEWI
ncbi:MAG: HNH endonuclease [Deltaproteobacteria bacterium]|nr:MAG: HNH endonuclease [Deltaproteobacteria bacterium]